MANVKLFLDFWNFQLGWNDYMTPDRHRSGQQPVKILWKDVPTVLIAELPTILGTGVPYLYKGARIYASVNPAQGGRDEGDVISPRNSQGIGEARNLTDDRDQRDQMDKQSEDLNRDGGRCRGPVGRWLNSLASIRIGRGHPENPRQGALGQSASGFTNPSQYMCWPPLTESVEPVMKSASSATRNSTAREMSSGLPRRPTGIRAMIFVTTSAGTARTMSVLT